MMYIFNLIALLGGLAMFLYGMRLMGDGLKESASGPLKTALERLSNTPLKAFLLGLFMTALIQSSTATIVITSGLVGAGIIPLRQSLGIIVGANVGTTVTGQIIRLLDLNASGSSFLNFFQPSTLAPLALIIGVVLLMSKKTNGSVKVDQIIIGFGILFSGLMNMTNAVTSLTESGIIEQLFSHLGNNPLLAYLIGVGVAFVLQSSSAAIGILQAFSTSGQLAFNGIYAVLVGIYLGDCVTTAIVCNIGAKPEAKRVGVVNILFNLSKTVVILTTVTIFHHLGFLDGLWNRVVDSGLIANTNTVFNLSCAILLFPALNLYENISHKIVKDEPSNQGKYNELLDALNPGFFSTPAFAFGRCYEALLVVFDLAQANIECAFSVINHYDDKMMMQIAEREDDIDLLTDRVGNYLIQISAHISAPYHLEIMNHYYTAVSEFERLSDHAVNMAEVAKSLYQNQEALPEMAIKELDILQRLLNTILGHCEMAFRRRDLDAARHIEPLGQVVDDITAVMWGKNLDRLRSEVCPIYVGTKFFDLLSEINLISDICSNIGLATIVRAIPEMKHQTHNYIAKLHSGQDETFNQEYHAAYNEYFGLMQEVYQQ